MQAESEYKELVELISWIDQNTSGLSFPTDERTMIAIGCFDVALEHQAAIAILVNSSLHGSVFALVRVLSESLVRGLWLYSCATEADLKRFTRGKLNKSFAALIEEYEKHIETPSGVLSDFKKTAWDALNGFTHTGYNQISRRHSEGRVEGNYPDHEVSKTLGVAGALGLIAAGQLISISGKVELVPNFFQKMREYAKN